MPGPTYVAVCGPGNATEEELARAEEVGRLLGEAGAVVICGGMGGAMDAAAKGATGAGGMAVGLLPGDERPGASAHLTVSLPLGMGEARNALVARSADVVIAVGGEFGTLSEIALALKMGKPVVGLDSWELARQGGPVDSIVQAKTPAEAVKLALELAGS
ncbi:MAG TPA: TIGR00725 family protein [Actinomycetota bacterium]|nr:TIGR00725 family protein [Actinomycetota bacterium]